MCVYVYVYVCVYVYVYVCIYMCIYMRICVSKTTYKRANLNYPKATPQIVPGLSDLIYIYMEN
jgi:hypothetical protein